MSRVLLNIARAAVLIVVGCVTSAAAQLPAMVRVVRRPAAIQRWLYAPSMGILLEAEPGTMLDVLDSEGDWYWVIVPADAHGTRRAGWIRASAVEPVSASATALPAASGQRRDATPVSNASPAAVLPPNVADDKVTIRESRIDPAPASGNPAAASTKAYTFDDVHFDRNRDALRAEDMDQLRATVAALRADPSLVVTLEGHTCNLGTAAYNRALGMRRANAVKDFLVHEGIAADRLRTISRGEEQPKYDNSREESRRLNRRVAFVPGAQP